MKIKQKKGISLIVLVITIIVMIILAAAIILSLSSNGIIGKANKAKNDTDSKSIEELANVGYSEALMKGYNSEEELEREVSEYLAGKGIDVKPYSIEVTKDGLKIIKKGTNPYDSNGWDLAYVSNNGTWNDTPITKGNIAEGDIIAKFYKQESVLDMGTSGLPVSDSNAYHIVFEGSGAIPNLSDVSSTPWVGYAWAKPALAWYEDLQDDGKTELNPGVYPYITKVIICNGITAIGDDLCWMSISLEDVVIAEGVTSIGESVFENCSNLKQITLPSTLENISACAFENCPNLSDVYYRGSEEQWQKISVDNNNDCLLSATIQCEWSKD